MSIDNKLHKLKSELKKLESDKSRKHGRLEVEVKTLRGLIPESDDYDDDELEKFSKVYLAELTNRQEKTDMALGKQMKQIEAMAYESGIEI